MTAASVGDAPRRSGLPRLLSSPLAVMLALVTALVIVGAVSASIGAAKISLGRIVAALVSAGADSARPAVMS